jgi:hypothetical protein
METPAPQGLSGVANQAIGTFKEQPVLLAVLLVNLATVFGLFYVAVSVNGARGELIEKLIERCMPVRSSFDLLAPSIMTPRPLDVRKED